jgi:hypothetical protein
MTENRICWNARKPTMHKNHASRSGRLLQKPLVVMSLAVLQFDLHAVMTQMKEEFPSAHLFQFLLHSRKDNLRRWVVEVKTPVFCGRFCMK